MSACDTGRVAIVNALLTRGANADLQNDVSAFADIVSVFGLCYLLISGFVDPHGVD